MKKFVYLALAIIAAFVVYWMLIRPKDKAMEKAEKLAPLEIRQWSDSFNLKVDALMTSYMDMKDAFVDAREDDARKYAQTFSAGLDEIPLNELESDSSVISTSLQHVIADLKRNVDSLVVKTDITAMRKDFSTISDLMYPGFVTLIKYEGPQLYVQHCPMAFDDEIGANWLSREDEVVNPYLGKYHHKYKAGMLHCGEVKDSFGTKP